MTVTATAIQFDILNCWQIFKTFCSSEFGSLFESDLACQPERWSLWQQLQLNHDRDLISMLTGRKRIAAELLEQHLELESHECYSIAVARVQNADDRTLS